MDSNGGLDWWTGTKIFLLRSNETPSPVELCRNPHSLLNGLAESALVKFLVPQQVEVKICHTKVLKVTSKQEYYRS